MNGEPIKMGRADEPGQPGISGTSDISGTYRVIKYLTFDCYDTLVAYTAAKADAIQAMVAERGGTVEAGEVAVAQFRAREYEMHRDADFQPLSVVLRACLQEVLTERGMAYGEADGDRIIQAVKDAPVFPDVAPVLRRLRTKYKTAILSNSETDIIQHNVATIGVPFDQVVLAEQARCYKPDQRMFQTLLERCGCEVDEIVHIAQGFYHDIIPGHALGLRRIWINRNNLAGDQAYAPYDELTDLNGVPDLLGL
jgi:2-haloacid dehalogenase